MRWKSLQSAMLDAFALATLFAYGPKSSVTDARALPLKSKLIDALSIGNNCTNESGDDEYDPWHGIHRVQDRLCTFAEDAVGKPGPMMSLLNPGGGEQGLVAAIPERRRVVSSYLNERERENLARLIVKDVDRYTYKMHCRSDSCACCVAKDATGSPVKDSDDVPFCEFRLIGCPNAGCEEKFSFKHAEQHDGACGYKLVPCPNECSMEVARNDVHAHVRDTCPLRRAECPLKELGCASIVQAKFVCSHLTEHADTHFMLIASRMMEYQSVIRDMNTRVRLLEEKNAQLERELKRVTLQTQSKDDAKTVSNDLKKLTKRMGTLEGKCRTEFKKADSERKKNAN